MKSPHAFRRLRIACALSATCLALSTPATAATFCVSSGPDLRAALAVAASNNENDIISIVNGTYAVTAPLAYHATELRALYLIGGYAPGCTGLAASGAKSTIDGGGSSALLDVVSAGDVTLMRLAWHSGRSHVGDNAFVIQRQSGASGRVRLWQNELRDLAGYADANTVRIPVYVAAGGQLDIANSVFRGIDSGYAGREAIDLLAGSSADGHGGLFVNNTVTANIVEHDSLGNSGVVLFDQGGDPWLAANNILYGNLADHDIVFEGTTALFHNDIGSYLGTPADGIGTNPSVDPGFVDAGVGDYRLGAGSVLIDGGYTGAYPGAKDFDDQPRVAHGTVDMGAWEFQFGDLIFADGFE